MLEFAGTLVRLRAQGEACFAPTVWLLVFARALHKGEHAGKPLRIACGWWFVLQRCSSAKLTSSTLTLVCPRIPNTGAAV